MFDRRLGPNDAPPQLPPQASTRGPAEPTEPTAPTSKKVGRRKPAKAPLARVEVEGAVGEGDAGMRANLATLLKEARSNLNVGTPGGDSALEPEADENDDGG